MEDFNYSMGNPGTDISEYSFDTDSVITTVLEEEYPQILSDLKKYIEDGQENIVKTMIEFCHDFNLSLDLLADIINTDLELKGLIHEFCINTNVFRA